MARFATGIGVTTVGDFIAHKRNLLIAALVAVWVVSAAVAVYYLAGGSYETSWGESISRSDEYVSIYGETLTQDDLEYIASLRRLRSLRLSDCNVAECRLPELKFASRNLWNLDLSGTEGLWDLSFLSTVPADTVNLSNCPHVDSLSTINKDVVTDLEIDGTEVEDLSPLIGSQIERISFANTKVSDIRPLSEMGDQLWEVDGSDTQVTSIDALASSRWLSRIRFDGCPIEKVETPFESEILHELSLARTQVSDLSAFSGCTGLQLLDLSGNEQLEDVSWLDPECYKTLGTLRLGSTGLDAQDVEWVASCTGLEELVLDGIELGNLDLCKRMRHLLTLGAVDCGLTDITTLSACKELETLLLGYNQLQSLEGLPAPGQDWATAVYDLSHNQLTSARDLPAGDYRLILLHGNDPDLGRTVPSTIRPYMVSVDWFSGIEDSALSNISSLSTVYLLGCPNEEPSKYESPWWTWKVKYVSEDELLTILEEDNLSYGLYETDFTSYVDIARRKLSDKG